MNERPSQKQTKNVPTLWNSTQNVEVAPHWVPLETFSQRFIGLMGKKTIPNDTAFWINPCPSIHSFFMLADIDVIFLDQEMKVLRTVKRMTPWRVEGLFSRATSVIEGAPGLIAGGQVQKGDQLKLVLSRVA